MATTFKDFTNSDIVNTKTLLNEVIPLTGTIVSGTYSDNNIKNYAHGMFQSVYDYPYLSSSANHIFDFTFGYAATSSFSSSANTQNDKKLNIYNQMAQVLAGYDVSGNIQRFDQNGDLSEGNKINEGFVFSFARLLTKDEIKKGSFTIALGTANAYATPFTSITTLGDYGAASEYRTNSPAGEYGILYTSSATPNSTSGYGLIYYQAGVVILSASVFGSSVVLSGSSTRNQVLTGSTIQTIADSVRHRIQNIQFNNTTELNSTIYFCRANHNEFNYSSNPTYVSSSKIVVKNEASDPPISYITTVGLYSADNELMAVAKLSEPLKKSVDNEIVIRTRLDY